MSTAGGSNPTQSRVFVDELRRRARRQVLGALALLFLSLTVLPVLFEKRPVDPSAHPKLRWEPTPPIDENDPSASKKESAAAEEPIDYKQLPTNDDAGSAEPAQQVARIKALAPNKTSTEKIALTTPAPTETATAEEVLAPTPAAKHSEKAKRYQKVKPTLPHDHTLGVAQLRHDELDDVPPKRTPRKTDGLDKATKTRLSASDNTSEWKATKATKERISDERSANGGKSYIIQLNPLGSEEKARELRNRLAADGVNASVVKISSKQHGTIYRLRVGQRTNQREQAEQTLKTLHNKGYNAVLVPLNNITPSSSNTSAN